MTRVLILESQVLLRQSLAVSLKSHGRMEIGGTYADGTALLADREGIARADVALLDLRLGAGPIFELAADLGRIAPKLRLVWLAAIGEDVLLEKALEANLPGFVHKDDTLEVLVAAIEAVVAGRLYHSAAILRLKHRHRAKADRFSLLLSAREQEVLSYLGTGFSNEEVAARLGLSAATIKAHRRNIMARLGLHTAIELQAYVLKIGLVEPGALRLSREG